MEFNIPSFLAVSHLSGAILLMNIWETKKQDPDANVDDDIADVHTCLRALELGKERWEIASMFFGFLKAGLPDSEKTKPPGGPPPSRPSPARSQPEQAHDRAMQPPRLTDGWHWFSQVDIASQYQPPIPAQSTEQSAVDIKPYTRFSDIPRPHSVAHADTSYSIPQPLPSYRIHALPTQRPTHSQAPQSNIPVVTTVTGQLPWWAEAAVDGRPAYGTAVGEFAKFMPPEQTTMYYPPPR